MAKPKYAYREGDTKWDEYHRKNGMMTNKEFFTSNGKGGFYEGMEWDGEEWVPNAERRERQEEYDSMKCEGCDSVTCYCM